MKRFSLLFLLLTVICGISANRSYSVTHLSSQQSKLSTHAYHTLYSSDETTILMELNEAGKIETYNSDLDRIIFDITDCSPDQLDKYRDDLVVTILTGTSDLGFNWPIKCRTNPNCITHGSCFNCWLTI